MKTAIVTGGTSGIGLGVAEMLVKKGYHVIVTHSKDIKSALPEGVEAIRCDQSERAQTYRFLEEVKSRFQTIDCIVCNAGFTIRKSFTETTDADWDSMMEVAVNSHYIMIRELYERIPNGSRIIFTGSQMGIHPHATVLAYGVTKAAVHALVKNLVKEFEGTDTTVNAIVPGFVETPWQREKSEEIRTNIYQKTAIHRFASIDEIVKGYEFCIDNPFVNGSLIEINGGYCCK
ncbi:MAG: SDR family oxidoreductase [Bacteroides sp.]|nr:SDR family oxidoreductase [Bacteroides sp.]